MCQRACCIHVILIIICQNYESSTSHTGEKRLALPDYLTRPWCRIDEYITILKDLLKYTAKAKQDYSKLEQTIEMLMDIKKQADDLTALDNITNYPGNLADLGPVFRHVCSMLICSSVGWFCFIITLQMAVNLKICEISARFTFRCLKKI